MYSDTPKQDISFDINNSSKLKIVVDSANNNIDGDWGVLGDAKLIKDNKKFDYLSDIDWQKATTSHGNVNRDIAHDGTNKLTLKSDNTTYSKSDNITYSKGVGIHSSGEIIIDLTNKDYKNFQTSVGILQHPTKRNPNESVIFKFYLDDQLVASTGIMYSYTPKQDISFDINNASKLKIVVDSANNNIDGDWGVLGDARLVK